jgi:hypothetical protein
VSALGHYLEEEGIATVAISLIRPQTERTKAPRALWVPFELGRPFGPPGDAAFQTRVVTAALRLLESERGPVLIEDFPDDDPRAAPDPSWQEPIRKASLGDVPPAVLAEQLVAEIPLLARAYEQARAARGGRTTVGLSRLSIEEAGRTVAQWLAGETPPSPDPDVSPPLMLRFASDDLKAYYTEAAAAAGKPSSRQLGDWFWNETAAGAALFALRRVHVDSADDRLKLIAAMFLVPGARVPPAV